MIETAHKPVADRHERCASWPRMCAVGLVICVMLATPASGQTGERRIYQVDSVGNILYHKPSFTIQKEGRVIETDTVGNKLYHKQQYVIVGDRVLPVDSLGNVRNHKPAVVFTDKR